ncbi:MAG: hypothetical protein ACI4XO_00310 [Akkermansia sp.]
MNEQENPEPEEYRPQLMRLAERRLSPMLRRLMGAEDVVKDWLSTEAAAGQAVQLVGRFPNTPGEVSRWFGCC